MYLQALFQPEYTSVLFLLFVMCLIKRHLLLFDFGSLNNKLYTALAAENTAVQGKVVVFNFTPFPAGKIFIVNAALAVLFFKAFLRALITYSVKLDDSFCSVFVVGVNKHVKTVVAVSQNIIGTSAYYYTVSLFGKLGNNTALGCPKIVGCAHMSR